jgi:hypothetical protein
MNLFAFSGQDNTGPCASTGNRADGGPFFASGNRAYGCANAGATGDDFPIPRL